MIRLGVNVDHVATIRQARLETYPDPVEAAFAAQRAGADNITCHLREDRRHIQDRDVERLKELIDIPLNFEIAATSAMIEKALQIQPHAVTLVPEKRAELTTESGLVFDQNLVNDLKGKVSLLKEKSILVSLFIDLDDSSVESAHEIGVDAVEFHTGPLCRALDRIKRSSDGFCLMEPAQRLAKKSNDYGMQSHFGHGLHYHNAHWLQLIDEAEEANIGHSIVARSVICGFEKAVKQMKDLLNEKKFRP